MSQEDSTKPNPFSEERWRQHEKETLRFFRAMGMPESKIAVIIEKRRMSWLKHRIHWEERERVRAEHGPLFPEVLAILRRYDPVGIAYPENPDEYELEVGTILPRLPGTSSAFDVLAIVREEFLRWFSIDIARKKWVRLDAISAEIWEAWCIYRDR